MEKYYLVAQYKNGSFGIFPFLAAGFRDAGLQAEDIIDNIMQSERKKIRNFDLEDENGCLGRFYPIKAKEHIMFYFSFE